jgi:hypothetical protein
MASLSGHGTPGVSPARSRSALAHARPDSPLFFVKGTMVQALLLALSIAALSATIRTTEEKSHE